MVEWWFCLFSASAVKWWRNKYMFDGSLHGRANMLSLLSEYSCVWIFLCSTGGSRSITKWRSLACCIHLNRHRNTPGLDPTILCLSSGQRWGRPIFERLSLTSGRLHILGSERHSKCVSVAYCVPWSAYFYYRRKDTLACHWLVMQSHNFVPTIRSDLCTKTPWLIIIGGLCDYLTYHVSQQSSLEG